jgi:hypothetical protein
MLTVGDNCPSNEKAAVISFEKIMNPKLSNL